MSDEIKLARDGRAVVYTLPTGNKLSVQVTPAGVRVNLHEQGSTRPVEPGDYGVVSADTSTVGGGNPRFTIRTPNGTSIDFTRRDDGSTVAVVHQGGSSRPFDG